jgi:predicted transcriptional regulator
VETDILGPLERRVMEHFWGVGPSTVADVLEALNRASSRTLAYTTVLTIVARLHDKGYLARTREGRAFRYAAAFDEASLPGEVGRRELHRLIDKHGAATVAGFAADLEGADSELTARLAQLAKRRQADR